MLSLGRLLIFFPLLLRLASGEAEEDGSCEASPSPPLSASPASSPSSSSASSKSSSSSFPNFITILESLGVAKECEAENKECSNSTVVARQLEASWEKFNITCRQEAACLTGLMLLESGNATFKRNKFPGVPGQGTCNMQMCPFNLKWAQDLAKEESADGKGTSQLAKYADVQTLECSAKGCKDAEKCDEVLTDVLKTDKGNLFTPAWFYATQCNKTEIKEGLKNDVKFCPDYLTECVGTNGTDEERTRRNQKVFEAFDVVGKTTCVPL
ncbi:hypothetical protein CP532_4593 [Ophiocordyceps camponoti-leonardi (nom. inval.)]|nr:hypothetical protein CP532_4593 [Ophiocordyceps camponoti-leonardi (nom. inval.)]